MILFPKTLTDMQKLISNEIKKANDERDWTEIEQILTKHQKVVKGEKHNLTDAATAISDYSRNIEQMRLLIATIKNGNTGMANVLTKEIALTIANAKKFESTIVHVAEEMKKLE